MWAVHTDTEHIHVHFIVSNCNVKTGKSFRRGMPELKEMSQFFGEQCMERGLTHSVRDTFYNEERTQERKGKALQNVRCRIMISCLSEKKSRLM